jgi:2'-aminobiphenyl-2,3-diol 1,2-dioxygenase, small subunit
MTIFTGEEEIMASYATESLVNALTTVPGVAERFAASPEAVFNERGVPQAERAALLEGSPPALAGIGLHPILQIHYFIGTKSPVAERLDGSLLDRLGGK